MGFIGMIFLLIFLFAYFAKIIWDERKRRNHLRRTRLLEQRHYPDRDRERGRLERLIEQVQGGKIHTEKRRKTIPFTISIIILSGISFGLYIAAEGGEKGTTQAQVSRDVVNEILLAVGGQKEDCDPVHQIERESEMTEAEILTDMAQKTLCLDWYTEAPDGKSERVKYYVEQITARLEAQEGQALSTEVGERRRTESENLIYQENVKLLDGIENSKVPKDATREEVEKGTVKPLAVSGETYLLEYALRWQCYVIQPAFPMLRQMAKAAEDAAISLAAESFRAVEMMEAAGWAFAHYSCLMRFRDTGESKADCCYWIAKLFCVIAEHLPADCTDLIAHCKLMAYAFCQKGMEYLNTLEEANDHGDELKELYETVKLRIA